MSTIGNERLEKLSSGNAWTCVQDDEAKAMATELLALRKEREKADTVGVPDLHKVVYHFRDLNEGFPVERFKADYVIAWMLANYPPAPVVADAATAIRACLDEFPESVHDIVEECADIAENASRAAMIQDAMQPCEKCGLNGIHACLGGVETDTTSQQFESLAGKAVGEDASSMADAHMAWLNTNFPRNAYSDEEWEEVSLYTWLAWRDSQRNACFPGT